MAVTTNQGLILPDAGNNANVPLTFTDFVTTAVSGIENRLVERYVSIADRTARNPAPNEGELSYLSDLDRYETYTGTVWLTLLPANAFNNVTTSFTNTSTVYTIAGGTVVGETIVVPNSGRIRVDWSAQMSNTGANFILVAPQLNNGNVVGAGAVLAAANDFVSIEHNGTTSDNHGSFTYYTGLTPGTSVNAFLMHRTGGGTATYARRQIDLEQR
jgi:hypothetical protein